MCLFGFMKATKFRDSSEYSQCVQNVWQRVASLVKFYTKQKIFLLSAERPRYEFSASVLYAGFVGSSFPSTYKYRER